ncbi:hypothetical protein M8818_003818 [Zalaria obscura]|uniref:Uncharacterized protein n=1 Tax=Zalaria obscura TaxID=2024903 RepID=A0ACC3SHX2_9PEZI
MAQPNVPTIRVDTLQSVTNARAHAETLAAQATETSLSPQRASSQHHLPPTPPRTPVRAPHSRKNSTLVSILEVEDSGEVGPTDLGLHAPTREIAVRSSSYGFPDALGIRAIPPPLLEEPERPAATFPEPESPSKVNFSRPFGASAPAEEPPSVQNAEHPPRNSSLRKAAGKLRKKSVAVPKPRQASVSTSPRAQQEAFTGSPKPRQKSGSSVGKSPKQRQQSGSSAGKSPRQRQMSEGSNDGAAPEVTGSRTQYAVVQGVDVLPEPMQRRRSSIMFDPASYFKRNNTTNDLATFAMGTDKSRKQSLSDFTMGAEMSQRKQSDPSGHEGHDPITAPPLTRSAATDTDLIRPPLTTEMGVNPNPIEGVRELLLVNSVTGERRRSVVRPMAAPDVRRPSMVAMRRDSRRQSQFQLVRRDSTVAQQYLSRPTHTRSFSTASFSRRSVSGSVSGQGLSRNSSFSTPNKHNRSVSFATPNTTTQLMLTTPQTPATHQTRPSIAGSASSADLEAGHGKSPTTPTRRQSVWNQASNTLFGGFSFGGRRDSTLPTHEPNPGYNAQIQEPTPAYNAQLPDDEMQLIEIPISEKPGSGWLMRRTSIMANVFSDKDIDVDPDLELDPEASDKQIDHAIQEARTQRGNRKMLYSRNFFLFTFFFLNACFLSFAFADPTHWYIIIPFVVFTSLVNSVMVLNLTRIYFTRRVKKVAGKLPEPEIKPMNMMTVLPCYNESYEELMGTLESITTSEGIDMHKHMIIIVCDGKVRGKGQAKTTPQILLEDILTDNSEEHEFKGAYAGWNHERNTLWVRRGYYKGFPYICTVKQSNRGKRDGLIMVRNLLYAYNHRKEFNRHSFSPEFYDFCRTWGEINDFEKFDYLVGTDADTLFEKGCIAELYRQTLMDPNCVGTCGLIKVGFRTGKWSFWNLYQNAEYIRGQMLRRLHQSYATHRVTCLPGACQIIKICDETCGPKIMDELFGYYPKPMDNLIQQIRSLAGEDRNYVVNMFFAAPTINTRQAIRAVAYTDPPTSLSVFLSQRRRWTLSTCANDLIVIRDNRMVWFERLSSIADLMTWFLPVFILATVANFLKAAILHHNVPLLVGMCSVVMLPWLYTFISVIWVPETMEERLQYLAGLLFLALLGPFMTALVIGYAIKNSHVFGWGKTRQLEDDGDASKPAH